MTLQLGDVQTTALIPVAIKASETLRKNARIKDDVAVEIVRHLEMDTKRCLLGSAKWAFTQFEVPQKGKIKEDLSVLKEKEYDK